MILYHGTRSSRLSSIFRAGLLKPYLTSDLEIAEYYAEERDHTRRIDYGDHAVILAVEVDESDTALKPDYPSFDEPLSFFLYELAEDEKDWFNRLDSGDIPSPENQDDWQTSLEVVRSVHYKGVILPGKIKVLE
jgi:hypothetical protein